MKVKDSRIEDGRLVLTSGGREFSLPDGVYRQPDGESVTIQRGRIVAALTPIDVENATRDDLALYVEDLEGQLTTIGSDAQLASIELQNALQKQQQLMQMMSQISKMMHDTAMAIIRNLR
jgi:hypothetical protein